MMYMVSTCTYREKISKSVYGDMGLSESFVFCISYENRELPSNGKSEDINIAEIFLEVSLSSTYSIYQLAVLFFQLLYRRV